MQEGPGKEDDHEVRSDRTGTGPAAETTEVPGAVIAEAARASAQRSRRQLIGAVAIAALSVGAAVSSMLGQGISYRQMRATESIADSLARIANRPAVEPTSGSSTWPATWPAMGCAR